MTIDISNHVIMTSLEATASYGTNTVTLKSKISHKNIRQNLTAIHPSAAAAAAEADAPILCINVVCLHQ
jgi:hypothetical protein